MKVGPGAWSDVKVGPQTSDMKVDAETSGINVGLETSDMKVGAETSAQAPRQSWRSDQGPGQM